MLESLGGLEGAAVVDLYAGSGSFGIESLSRGAASAVFVEQDRNAIRVLQKNLNATGFEASSTVIAKPVAMVLPNLPPADITFCDPPYALEVWPELFDGADTELLVGHAESQIDLGYGWEELRRRRYGRSHILIANRPIVSEEPHG